MDESPAYDYLEDVNWGLLRLWNGRTGLRVLDVGCGYATTSEYIQKLGNDVTGIEQKGEACRVAATRISRLIEADLLYAELGEMRYDVVILADVLEHVAWPVGVLRRYFDCLAPGGSMLISLPNVALWSVRLSHLAGRWEYQETGVLDRTHLRFFTRKSALWLLAQAGLTATRTTYNPGVIRPFVPLAKKLFANGSAPPAPDAPLRSLPYQIYMKTLYPVERAAASVWPGMLAFQMIFEAKPIA